MPRTPVISSSISAGASGNAAISSNAIPPPGAVTMRPI